MKIAIVIPGLNEARRIGGVIEQLFNLVPQFKKDTFDIVVVDDGSTDAMPHKVKSYQPHVPKGTKLHLLRHRTNLGKGSAALTGCEAAKRLKTDLTVLMDGDGQHQAHDVSRLIEALAEQDKPALIIGARQFNESMPFMMRFGNAVMNRLAHLLFKIKVQDSQSGLRAFPTEVHSAICWASSSYAMETEMLIMARASRIPIIEVPIETVYHDNHKGTTPLDGLRILQTLLTWRFFRSPVRHLATQKVRSHNPY